MESRPEAADTVLGKRQLSINGPCSMGEAENGKNESPSTRD